MNTTSKSILQGYSGDVGFIRTAQLAKTARFWSNVERSCPDHQKIEHRLLIAERECLLPGSPLTKVSRVRAPQTEPAGPPEAGKEESITCPSQNIPRAFNQCQWVWRIGANYPSG